jgi:predicted small lipoprotein YifL
MLRDPRSVPRPPRRLVLLAAAALVATGAGCGIKGPLKRADAPASTSTAAPPTTPPDPTLPVK